MAISKQQTQRGAVRDYLMENGSITGMEAFELFGATRLSAIIFDLRKLGYDIETQDVTIRNRFGQVTTYAKYVFNGVNN